VNEDQELHDASLRELARRLGARAAERLDVERTAQAVVSRLRERPGVTVAEWVGMQPARLKIAAALVLLLGAGLITRGLLTERAPSTAVVLPLGLDLTMLTADELREAIGALEQPLSEETTEALDAGLESLNATQLRALLRAMET
jgi:hypothetical protein